MSVQNKIDTANNLASKIEEAQLGIRRCIGSLNENTQAVQRFAAGTNSGEAAVSSIVHASTALDKASKELLNTSAELKIYARRMQQS